MSDVLVQKEEGLIEMILKPNAELLMQPIKADRRSIARAICEDIPNQFQEVMDFLKTVKIPSDFEGVIKACEEHDVYVLGQLLEMMGRRPGIIKQTATRLKLIEFYERVIHIKPFDMVKQSKWRHNVQPLERLSFDCFMGILNYPLVNDRYSDIEDLVNVIQYTGASSYVLEPINMDKHNKMRIAYLKRGISTYGQLLKAADSDCDRLWKLIDQCDHDYFTSNRQLSLTAKILGIFSDEFKEYVWAHVFHNDSNLKVL